MVRACQFCRRRKVKCDGVKPSCSTCRGSNRPCIYHNGPQKQRPSAALINSLKKEKTALEETLSLLKRADDTQRRALLESMTLENGRVLLPQSAVISTTQSSPEHAAEQEQHQQLNHPGIVPLDLRVREAVNGDTDGHNDNDGGHDYAMSSSDEDGFNITDQPPSINGSHRASDSIYSSTSVIRVSSPARALGLDAPSHEQRAALVEGLRYRLIANSAMERQREYRMRALTTIRGIPAELAFHLLDLHWNRQHHTFLLTYRPTFMRELVNGGPYCSDLLLYAVFACASKFSERLEVRSDPTDPETAGQQFFSRCDQLLQCEGLLSQSQISTVVALLMLGSTFIARGKTSKGWLYTGYALRMVYDLELHVDSQELTGEKAEEIEIRRRVFWGAFICEKLQSLYLGRPPTIRLRDAHVSLDFMDTFEELEPWEPYNDPTTPDVGPKAVASQVSPAYSVSVFQQLCLLSKIMTRILNKIYFVGATARKTVNEIRPLDDALASWYSDLPAHLAYEPWTKDAADATVMVAPNRIILLTTYHFLVVLLHRPFISISSSDVAANNTASTDRNGVDDVIKLSAYSWKRCTTAARHITSLALSYRSIYPLRKSNYLLSYAVYVACTIHVLNTASVSAGSDKNTYAESSSLLSASLRCLDELAVPNSGVADTARIIRKLMSVKGIQEASMPVEFQTPAPHQMPENVWQFSPGYDDLVQMQPFHDIDLSGQDLLFGFMNENMSLDTFGIDNANF
ncbi:fungal-specific transcription factor domain-containing protein [Aspergillus ambiguus]|uniref:Zn(II)2Cys6 transcription factor n=1 Tax=Aspergillus ambiguus TaxID=176160 RepID=UPI003CCDE576